MMQRCTFYERVDAANKVLRVKMARAVRLLLTSSKQLILQPDDKLVNPSTLGFPTQCVVQIECLVASYFHEQDQVIILEGCESSI